jgi:hypothetical protein
MSSLTPISKTPAKTVTLVDNVVVINVDIPDPAYKTYAVTIPMKGEDNSIVSFKFVLAVRATLS